MVDIGVVSCAFDYSSEVLKPTLKGALKNAKSGFPDGQPRLCDSRPKGFCLKSKWIRKCR